MKDIIIDTDIGSDVDDLLAILLALSFPHVQLKAITLVSGEVKKRARLTSLLLQVTNHSSIPVALGREVPMSGLPPVYSWMPFEGHGLDVNQINFTSLSVSTSHLILETVRLSPQDTTLIAIGPLSNVAEALFEDRETMNKIHQIVVMGGAIRRYNEPPDSRVEYNIGADIQAAQVVFGSGIPIVVVPLNVTEQVALDRQGLDKIRAVGTEVSDFVYSAVDHYLTKHNKSMKYLHDPLTVSLVSNHRFVKTLKMKIVILNDGHIVAYPRDAKTNGSVCEVAISVDSTDFLNFFVSQIQTLCRNSTKGTIP